MSKPGRRAAAIANVLAVIDAVHEDCECEPGCNTLNDTMDNLLTHLDWDVVPIEAIKRAIRTILKNAPMGEVEDVSEHADSERTTLACVQADRLEDERKTDAERHSDAVAARVRIEEERTRCHALDEDLRTLGYPENCRSPHAGQFYRTSPAKLRDLVHLGLMLDGVGELEALVTWARFLVKKSPMLADTESRARSANEALVRQADLEASCTSASEDKSSDLN